MEATDELDALEGVGTALKTTGELDPIIARFVSRMSRLDGPAEGGGPFSEGKDGGFGGGGLEEEVAGAARAFDDFAEQHWHLFAGGEEEGEDEEQTHEAYQCFTQWSERFERETEAFLEEEKTDASDFYQVASWREPV